MSNWSVSALRREIDDGAPLSPRHAAAVLDALDRAVKAAAVPPEFMIRVARDTGDPDRWQATHPVLLGSRTASHPADALAMVSTELRRALARYDWPEPEWRAPAEVPRTVASALAVDATGDIGDALRWALEELDRRTEELHELRDARWLSERAETGDRDAQDELRRRAVAELRAAGVQPSERDWGVGGYGPSDTVGLSLPCLVVALPMEHRESVRSWRFTADRSWHALDHRVAPRPMSRYVRAIVSPLRIGADIELALRRAGPRVPDGRSVRDYLAFHELMAVALPGVDVGGLTDELSPAWVPLPTGALATLCRGTPDEHLDLDTLAEHDGFGPWASWWKLAWVTDDLGEGMW